MKYAIRGGYRGLITTLALMVSQLGIGSAFGAGSTVGLSIQDRFSPTGWMGDGEYGKKHVELKGASPVSPHSAPTCIEVSCTFGPKGWAGIYWQNKADNWGDLPGDNYSTRKFTKIVFWARGGAGGEVVEFKAGDVNSPGKKYHDSFSGTTGRVTLTADWQQYEIELQGCDLSSVIGGFCWVAAAEYNKTDRIVFYLDDIVIN